MTKKSILTTTFSFVIGISVMCLGGCNKTSEGSTGATGATGTANVMYSTWSTLNMTYNATDSSYEQTIAADSLTQPILDSGIVLCYIKYTNASNQEQVESAATYMEVVLGLKTITLYSYNYDYSGVSFRYIIIPGGNALNARTTDQSYLIQGYTKAQWQAMSYSDVVSRLGKK